ncbi:MAG: class I SAM-dependent methyltransferase [Candidatus Falkowbacteria bacterium]|nr:class I SAM-dependent methyltransferase [Candidatus Falkowbacteria bacterium]
MIKEQLELCKSLKVSPDYFLFGLYSGYFCDAKKLKPFSNAIEEVKKLLPKSVNILEIGGGNGMVGQYIKSCLSKLKVKANLTIIDTWKEGLDCNLDSTTKKVFGDNKKLPFKNASFDIVCARSVTHYEKNLKDINKVLGEVKRVLKSGGFYIDQAITFESISERKIFKSIQKVLNRDMTLNGSSQYELILRKYFYKIKQRKAFSCLQPQSDLQKRYPINDGKIQKIMKIVEKNYKSKNMPHFHMKKKHFSWDVPFTLFIGSKE